MRLQEDPLGEHFPWEGTPIAPRTPRVDFDIVAHSRPDAARLETPLRRPLGEPPPFGTGRPDSVLDPRDQGSSRQHRKSHDKRGGEQLGGWFASWRVSRVPGGRASSSGARPPAGSPHQSDPSTHSSHIQAKECGFKGRTKTATSPQARCASLPEYCIKRGAGPGGSGSSQS